MLRRRQRRACALGWQWEKYTVNQYIDGQDGAPATADAAARAAADAAASIGDSDAVVASAQGAADPEVSASTTSPIYLLLMFTVISSK